jgi:hypothetical protein
MFSLASALIEYTSQLVGIIQKFYAGSGGISPRIQCQPKIGASSVKRINAVVEQQIIQ